MVAALERHTGAGRLTLEEFEARVGVACGARTLDELAAVTSDLPASDDDQAKARRPRKAHDESSCSLPDRGR